MPYKLIRTLPSGQEKEQKPIASKCEATIFAAYVLHDNGAASKAEAQRFSVLLGNAALGETVTHHDSCYKFRIEEM